MDSLKNGLDLLVVILQVRFNFQKFSSQLCMCCQYLAEPYKCTYDEDAGFNRAWGIKNTCGHNRPMFCEGMRKRRREPKIREMVAICNHLFLFLSGGILSCRTASKSCIPYNFDKDNYVEILLKFRHMAVHMSMTSTIYRF